jgi:hypothetical protein
MILYQVGAPSVEDLISNQIENVYGAASMILTMRLTPYHYGTFAGPDSEIGSRGAFLAVPFIGRLAQNVV